MIQSTIEVGKEFEQKVIDILNKQISIDFAAIKEMNILKLNEIEKDLGATQ